MRLLVAFPALAFLALPVSSCGGGTAAYQPGARPGSSGCGEGKTFITRKLVQGLSKDQILNLQFYTSSTFSVTRTVLTGEVNTNNHKVNMSNGVQIYEVDVDCNTPGIGTGSGFRLDRDREPIVFDVLVHIRPEYLGAAPSDFESYLCLEDGGQVNWEGHNWRVTVNEDTAKMKGAVCLTVDETSQQWRDLQRDKLRGVTFPDGK
jgi:hypothetical protein